MFAVALDQKIIHLENEIAQLEMLQDTQTLSDPESLQNAIDIRINLLLLYKQQQHQGNLLTHCNVRIFLATLSPKPLTGGEIFHWFAWKNVRNC